MSQVHGVAGEGMMRRCEKVLHTWYFLSVCGKGEGTSSPQGFKLLYPRSINHTCGGHPAPTCLVTCCIPVSPLMIQKSNEVQRARGAWAPRPVC